LQITLIIFATRCIEGSFGVKQMRFEFDSTAFDSNSRVFEWSTFASDLSSGPDDRAVTRECIELFAR
jgi:hypothetical protein